MAIQPAGGAAGLLERVNLDTVIHAAVIVVVVVIIYHFLFHR